MNLAIFCVTYNSYDETLKFLASIDRAAEIAKDARIEVFVGDNTETDVREIAFHSPHFSLKTFSFRKNWGYFGAVSRMMEQEDTADCDFVVISNVDVTLDENFIAQLSRQETAEEVGWIAPQIFSTVEKRDRNPKIMRRYTKRKLQLLRLFFRFPLLYQLYTHTVYRTKKFRSHSAGLIYAGHGSFIVLTQQYLQRCGTVSYPVFLFDEEIYLAEECMRHGLVVEYRPSLRVIDEEHVSTGKIRPKYYYRYNYEALTYILKTYYR